MRTKARMLTGFIIRGVLIGTLIFYGVFFNLQSADAATGIYKTINFQGKVVNPDGTNVTNNTYQFDFALYTVSSGGSSVWTETANLSVVDGVFQHNLGSVTPLPGSVDFNTDNIYLGITFNSDAAGEMSPRIRFTAAPYAFNADKLDGLDSTQIVQLSPGAQQTGFINVSSNITSGGTMIASTSLQAPLIDTASAVALAIGTTNATAINLNKSTTVTGSGTLTVAGGATSLTGATSGVALTVSNSTSTGNIATFNDNATTVATIADGGAVTLQNSADSATAFRVLQLGGTALLTADTQNNLVRIADTGSTTLTNVRLFTSNAEVSTTLRVGNATNGVEFSTTSVVYRGTARPTVRVGLSPEYPGAVLTPDGSNNSGTMTSDFCSGTSLRSINTSFCAASVEHNYYQWASTSGTADYDVYIRHKIPSDFDTGSITAINMFGRRTTVSDSVTLELYNAAGNQCGTTTTITSSTGAWTETALANTGADSDCTAIAANDWVVWRVKLTSTGASNYAFAGEIRYDYRSKF